MTEWMKELSKEENNREFSQLTNEYYKLACMRIMQKMREKYKIPDDEVPTLMLAIFSRMLNEGCYSIGSNIKEGYSITDFYEKKHLLNLVKVLNGEALSTMDRDDIDNNIQIGLIKFREFILNNGKDFYV